MVQKRTVYSVLRGKIIPGDVNQPNIVTNADESLFLQISHYVELQNINFQYLLFNHKLN